MLNFKQSLIPAASDEIGVCVSWRNTKLLWNCL
jgi:hypothetical protein